MPGNLPGSIVPAVPFPNPVPLPILGTGLVTVTFDVGWLPYVIGACKTLTANSTYDPPTPAEVAAATSAAYDLLRLLGEAAPFVPVLRPPFSAFWDDDMSQLRQNPTNLCQLQVQCADGSWDTVFDASLCFGNPAPGAGVTPPAAGGCVSFNVFADSRTLTPLPFVVNTGDTIQATSILGASTDGSGHWYCPDGEIFVLGACAGGGHTDSGDPLPTTNHQALLLKIGSNYYPLTSALFTVPAGVVNQAIYVQTNDASLTNNVGTYHLGLTFCNQQTPSLTWCQTFDFTTSPHGWSAVTGLDGNGQVFGPAGWTAGVGWILHPQQPPPATTEEHYCNLHLDLGLVADITEAAFAGHFFHATGGTLEVGYLQGGTNPDYVTGMTTLFASGMPSYNADFGGASGAISINARYIRLIEQGYSYTGADDPIMKITSITLKGTGTNPFASSNCT